MAIVPISSLAEGGAAFGTSGVRGTVDALTDRVCFAYTAAFLDQVVARDAPSGPREVAVGHDLRPSSPRMVAACLAACAARGVRAIPCGALPTPALAHFALRRGIPAVVVTGSHIPFDRNGVKFYARSGEILKADEAAISGASVPLDDGAFDARGMLRAPPPVPAADPAAVEAYLGRYTAFFRPGFLAGRRVGLYQHSSVARDLLARLLTALGAEVIPLGRTDHFVPVDTEAVSEDDERQARGWVAEHRLDALVSTDGDADRPLLGDETGALLRGDAVGLLTAAFLGARTVVTPVSSNTAVERCGRFARVVRTRIGSPYVIAAMEEAARAGEAPVVGYEANGGFLLGSALERRQGVTDGALDPLPTRDAALPILSLLALAAEARAPLSRVVAQLPARFTASDRVKEFPTEKSRRLVEHLARDAGARAAFFAELGDLAEVNTTDGLRATLSSGDIVHLRPSGNAPELRCYAESGTAARAAELCGWGLARARRLAEQVG